DELRQHRVEQFARSDCAVKRSGLDVDSPCEVAGKSFLRVDNEAAHHSYAIFNLRIIAIVRAARQRQTRAQIKLIGQKYKSVAEAAAELALQGAQPLYESARE